jgi:hypothetical protein
MLNVTDFRRTLDASTVVQLWESLYGRPPPETLAPGAALEVLIALVGPLSYDQFYSPFLTAEPASPPREAAAAAAPLPSPARVRALDLALRRMLCECPVSDGIGDFVRRLGDEAP